MKSLSAVPTVEVGIQSSLPPLQAEELSNEERTVEHAGHHSGLVNITGQLL